MDNSNDANNICTECGAPLTAGHACASSTAIENATNVPEGTGAAEEPRIEIPDSLWASGLFKPAFTRPAATEEVRTPTRSRGSIFDLGHEEQVDEAPAVESTGDAPDPVVEQPPTDPFAWAQPENTSSTTSADAPVDTGEVNDPSGEDGVEDAPEADAVTPYDPFEGFGDPVADAPAHATPTHEDAADEEENDAEVSPFAAPIPLIAPDAAHAGGTAHEEDTVDAGVETIFDDTASHPTAHFGSADLPASVPFQPRATPPAPRVTSAVPVVEEVTEEKRSRKALLIGALVLVLVAATGGWFAWQRQQDAPVRTAFTASHERFSAGASQLRAATSIEQVALAGQEFAEAVPLLEETGDLARERGSSYATSARRASLAELEVARAGADLAELSSTSLTAWSTSRPALSSAFEEYADARTHVEAAGGTANDGLDDDLLAQIQQLIGDEVAGSAAENSSDLLDRLQAARLVADWRSIGDDAAGLVEPMKAAEQEFGSDSDKADDLAAYRSFFSSLTGLSTLRPATLDQWEQVKQRIENAVSDLPTAGNRASRVLAATDRRIVAARTTFTDWEQAHAEAKAEKERGLEQLRAARELVPEATETHAALRGEVASILSRGGAFPAEGNEGEAYRLLTASTEAHEALRARLAGLTVPSAAASEYAALIQVVADDAGAVRWASDAAAACTGNCDITERPGWNALSERAGVSEQDWERAREAWAAAATAARAELRALELPERPKI